MTGRETFETKSIFSATAFTIGRNAERLILIVGVDDGAEREAEDFFRLRFLVEFTLTTFSFSSSSSFAGTDSNIRNCFFVSSLFFCICRKPLATMNSSDKSKQYAAALRNAIFFPLPKMNFGLRPRVIFAVANCNDSTNSSKEVKHVFASTSFQNFPAALSKNGFKRSKRTKCAVNKRNSELMSSFSF